MCRQSPQTRKRRGIRSITRRLSKKRWNDHLRCISIYRQSITDPSKFRKYRSSHCCPSIAMNAASSETKRAPYMRPMTTTISLVGSSWTWELLVFHPGIGDRLRARVIAWRRVIVCSL
jgi:hypothetical protein